MSDRYMLPENVKARFVAEGKACAKSVRAILNHEGKARAEANSGIMPLMREAAKEAIKLSLHDGRPVLTVAQERFVLIMQVAERSVIRELAPDNNPKGTSDEDLAEWAKSVPAAEVLPSTWGNYKSRVKFAIVGHKDDGGSPVDPDAFKGTDAAKKFAEAVHRVYESRPRSTGARGQNKTGKPGMDGCMAELASIRDKLAKLADSELVAKILPALQAVNNQIGAIMEGKSAGETELPARAA